MKRFAVLVSNGLRYEYEAEIEATSVQAARKEWTRKHGGSWKAVDFKVSFIRG